MNKLLSGIMFIFAFILMSGSALAVTEKKQLPDSATYTQEQKDCVKVAQQKRTTAVKTATDALNAATKEALDAKQSAMKAALEIEDAKARQAAIKLANDTYNNNELVKVAKVPYTEAIKTANDNYQKDLKACLDGKAKGFLKNMFKGVGNGFNGFFGKIGNLFSGRK